MKKTLSSMILTIVSMLVFAQTDVSKRTHVRLIRNATLTFNYAGHKILLDPMFSAKGEWGSITGKERSPMVDLPIPVAEVLDGVELVLLTHTHFDHFDAPAVKSLNKSIKMINQPADRDTIQQLGFKNAETITDSMYWNNIKIIRTIAEHGTGRVMEMMGEVSGFILQASSQPTVYVVGDAIWTEQIYKNIKKYRPDYIIVNSGGATMPGLDATPIIMDENQTMSLVQESGSAKVIAVHMDAIDHCHTTRVVLKKQAEDFHIRSDKLIIPDDGEVIVLQ